MPREDRGDADIIDHPIHSGNLVTELRTPPQRLGESTDDELAELGYEAADVAGLRGGGVVD